MIDDKNTVHEPKKNYTNHKIFYRFMKRGIDLVFSLLGLMLGLPIIIIFCIFVVIETPGSPIYTQERLGLNGKKFQIIKIRSMYLDAEKDGAQWASENDARITKIGAFIRKTRIDEIPQLLNIVLGDMSIVGPRPEREEFTESFSKAIPDFKKRLLVKPGLTGLAQVNGGYDLSPEQKLQYDLDYLRNQNLVLDFKIMLSTIKVVLTGEGAR